MDLFCQIEYLWIVGCGFGFFSFPLDLIFLSAFTSFANENTNVYVEWYLFCIHSQQRTPL